MKPNQSLCYLSILIFMMLTWSGCKPDGPGPEDFGVLEPNNSMSSALPVMIGDSVSLNIYQEDKDWFKITVPAGSYVIVRIDFDHDNGDLDLLMYNSTGELIASKFWLDDYPYSNRKYETGTECHALYSKDQTLDYYFMITGYNKAINNYTLTIKEKEYADGCLCEEEGFTIEECTGEGVGGSGLLPFPLPAPNDPALVNNYALETMSNYRFGRREVIMLVRYAIEQTSIAFPGTTPLSLSDISQIDGLTPAQDVGITRHPLTTHDQGGNIDIAYYQTDGHNNLEVICGGYTSSSALFCEESSINNHIVDLNRQAYFIGKLFDSPRIRVIFTDPIIGPLILEAAEELAKLLPNDSKYLSEIEIIGIRNLLVWGDDFPYHHHHIHVSFNWW